MSFAAALNLLPSITSLSIPLLPCSLLLPVPALYIFLKSIPPRVTLLNLLVLSLPFGPPSSLTPGNLFVLSPLLVFLNLTFPRFADLIPLEKLSGLLPLMALFITSPSPVNNVILLFPIASILPTFTFLPILLFSLLLLLPPRIPFLLLLLLL